MASKEKAFALALSITKAFYLACQILQEEQGLFPATPERDTLFEPQHDDDTKVIEFTRTTLKGKQSISGLYKYATVDFVMLLNGCFIRSVVPLRQLRVALDKLVGCNDFTFSFKLSALCCQFVSF